MTGVPQQQQQQQTTTTAAVSAKETINVSSRNKNTEVSVQ
jgi:hypothetical protein